MKNYIKGIGLGISLVAAHKFCYVFSESFYGDMLPAVISGIIFFVIVTAFLVSKEISSLIICGATGLISMFAAEILTFYFTNRIFEFDILYDNFFAIYIWGYFGSMAAVMLAIIMTIKRIPKFLFNNNENAENNLKKDKRLKLLSFIIISAVSFSYLVMPQKAAISVPIFVLIQFICLWFIVDEKKRLMFLIPIGIMSMNCFLSAADIWRIPNFLISIILYNFMFINFDIKTDSQKYLSDTAKMIVIPFTYFSLPFRWTMQLGSKRAPVIKKIIIGLLIAAPFAVVLIIVLSNADMVFAIKTGSIISNIFSYIKINIIIKILCGLFVGIYLFGVICSSYTNNDSASGQKFKLNIDLITANVFLSVMLVIYTLFVIVQFKYLFAGSSLPDGLTYTEYARKGFFELLALTGVNIAVILVSVRLTKLQKRKMSVILKILCHYLCAITVALLISSFYRMLLYTGADGLTRMRFFVLGFLIFEAVGLIITFVYIEKQNFNISAVYIGLALVYYLMLNILPADQFIAKNQIDKYLSGERKDIEYVFTLSADAAPAMQYFYSLTEDEKIKSDIDLFFKRNVNYEIPKRWQRYNLSLERAKKF